MASDGSIKVYFFFKSSNDLALDTFSVRHSFPGGDLLSLLPGLRQIYRNTGKKPIIYQRVNLSYGESSGAYPGAVYSIKNEKDAPVTMNMAFFEALKPLLLSQDYIEDFKVWDGEAVHVDMDILRQQDTTMCYGSINRWPFYIWPDMACDLSEQSIRVSPVDGYSDKILINRTERYTNMLIDYSFLKKYEGKVLFIGLPKEHEIFCEQNRINIPHLQLPDFLELARAISCCKLYIGNQSALFQVAEHMKINRILEVFKPMPNVIGSGKGFYDFLHQNSLEYYCEKLFNE